MLQENFSVHTDEHGNGDVDSLPAPEQPLEDVDAEGHAEDEDLVSAHHLEVSTDYGDDVEENSKIKAFVEQSNEEVYASRLAWSS